MRFILKARWLILVLWLVAVVGLVMTAPNMEKLVREKGQIGVPDGYSSSDAAALMKEMNKSESTNANGLSTIVVFHRPEGLTSSDITEVKRAVQLLRDSKATSGITSVTSPFDAKELEAQMIAKDGKTILTVLNVALNDRSLSQARDALYNTVSDVKVDHYFSGGWLIDEDVVVSSQNGLKKTEGITVVLILVILFIVFRSLIAPFIPLLTVGLSYVAAQSIVAFLVDGLDFPLSQFTQIFMVVVMFGIGTDYCILLISRFKEELAHRGDKTEAIIATYRTAGKTVLVSALVVLVGFASIGFSTFSLYQSAVAVAVGIAVMMVALVTFVPFFMAVFGKAIFWPTRGSLEHKPSALWATVGRFSLKRPLLALAVIAAISVPFLSVYKSSLSFNSLEEIGSQYKSATAFQIISDSFGPGETLPSTVVMKAKKPLDTQEGLAMLEQVGRELAKVDGVKTVRGATRPIGEPLSDLQVTKQVETVGTGLGQGAGGLTDISKGLAEASSSLGANAPALKQAAAGAGQLVDGTTALKSGVVQLGDGIKGIERGLQDGSAGAGELKGGLQQAKQSADQLVAAGQDLLTGYKELGKGLGQLQLAYSDVAAKATALANGLTDVSGGLGELAKKYPDMAKDPAFVKAQGVVTQLGKDAALLSSSMKELNGQLDGLTGGLKQANSGYEQALSGQKQLTAGLATLANGLGDLQAGIVQAATGQGQIATQLPGVTQGLDKLAAGQKDLQSGFSQLDGQLGQLTSGLNQSVSGLSQVTGGLKSAQDFLKQLSSAPNKEITGWYVPGEALKSKDFQESLNVYLSKDRTIAKFDVVFKGNPYAVETLGKTSELKDAVTRALKGTAFADSTYGVGGVTSSYNDLNQISTKDYSQTVIFMLIGIGLILIVLFRSLVIPFYLLLSLVITYFTSMAIAEVIFVRMLGYTGLSWTVPFFGFVLLVALGVDYSIFLMDRFKEYGHLRAEEAILLAMKNMGTVIMSAALILGGTFAAMLPSGVQSLLQIATIVLSGLALYAFVMLPLFIPVMVRTFGEANNWPFMGRRDRNQASSETSASTESTNTHTMMH